MAQDILANGFARICIDSSANFLEGACKVLVIGQGFDASVENPMIPNVVTPVNNERDLPELFGRGSILSEALRTALCTCAGNVQLFAIPLADPAAGVAAVYTTTITGPATSDGRFTLFLGNDAYSIDINVESGDTVADIAAAVVAAVPADFPYIAAAIATGVTFTARNKGTVGNYLNPVFNWAGRRNYAPAGVTVSTVRTTAGAGEPVMPNLLDVIGDCCYSCFIYTGDDEDGQDALQALIKDAWDCSKPQCFGHGYVYNAGTLGQILATGNNAAELSRVAFNLSAYEFPWQVATNYGTQSCCVGCVNPEVSIQGPEYGILECIRIPQSCKTPWTFDELVQLREAGFVTYGPSGTGTGQLTNPQIYNDVTNYLVDELGRPNTTWRDTSSRRQAVVVALELAEKLNEYNGMTLFTKNTRVVPGVKGTTVRMMEADLRTWFEARIGRLFSEPNNMDDVIRVVPDSERAPKCRGNPKLIWVDVVYGQPNAIGQINTNLQPRQLDNCDR